MEKTRLFSRDTCTTAGREQTNILYRRRRRHKTQTHLSAARTYVRRVSNYPMCWRIILWPSSDTEPILTHSYNNRPPPLSEALVRSFPPINMPALKEPPPPIIPSSQNNEKGDRICCCCCCFLTADKQQRQQKRTNNRRTTNHARLAGIHIAPPLLRSSAASSRLWCTCTGSNRQPAASKQAPKTSCGIIPKHS